MTLNLNTSIDTNSNPALLSPLTLAFIGDTVFDLLVREYFVTQANRPVKVLHSLAAQRVCAGSQAKAVGVLLPTLSEEELAVFRRGRNAHTSHTPKNASGEEYHLSTAFECLMGYLYLMGRNDRIAEIFENVQTTWTD